ncbi:hypothetical protein KCV00_g412, partial [Aureobasidium melanogenum]
LNRGVELLRVELDAIDQLDKATKVDVMIECSCWIKTLQFSRHMRLCWACRGVPLEGMLLLNFLEELLADVMEVLLELVLDNLLEDLDVDRLDVLLVEMLRSLLDNLKFRCPGLSLDELVDLLTDRKLVTVLLKGLTVRDILASLLLEAELDGLLLDVRLLVANRLDDEIVERLLIGRLDVFDEDRDTPLSRTELIEALLGPIEVEVFAVTVTITVRVTNVRGGVNVATAMRLDLIVVIRRAVSL